MLNRIRKIIATVLLRGIDINHAKKCDNCLEEYTWQTPSGHRLCGHHYNKFVKQLEKGK